MNSIKNQDPLVALCQLTPVLNEATGLEHAIAQIMGLVIGWSAAERACLALLESPTTFHFTFIHNLNDTAAVSDLLERVTWNKQGATEVTQGRSVLCTPLVSQGQALGGIYLDTPVEKKGFTKNDLETLDIFAAQAALIIANERLRQAARQVEESKAKFVSVVSHELRIPMTSIKGYTDLMHQGAVGPVNEMQVNFLNVIRNNVERMSNLISNLSDFSKLESGQLNLNCCLLALRHHVGQALEKLRTRIEEKGQALKIDIPADLPQVYADPVRLEQVITDLVTNAWKYTPAGGEISVSAIQQEHTVRLAVSDSGIGISAQDQEKIFSPFFRSEDQAVREEQGWGLSLAVCKYLIVQMGGQIGFESAPGKGSIFWLELSTTEPPDEENE